MFKFLFFYNGKHGILVNIDVWPKLYNFLHKKYNTRKCHLSTSFLDTTEVLYSGRIWNTKLEYGRTVIKDVIQQLKTLLSV